MRNIKRKIIVAIAVFCAWMWFVAPFAFSTQNYGELFDRCERTETFSLQIVCEDESDHQLVREVLDGLRTKILLWEDEYPEYEYRIELLDGLKSDLYERRINTDNPDEQFILEITDFYLSVFIIAYQDQMYFDTSVE